MLPLMLNAALTVLAKEGKENVTVTLDSMMNCLQKKGVILLNSRSGSVYIRYNPGEHNLTAAGRPECNLYISAPSGMHIYIEILAETTTCMFELSFTNLRNRAVDSYCANFTGGYILMSKQWLVPHYLAKLEVYHSTLTTPFVLHFRFKAVKASSGLQLHYDSPKQGK